MIFTIEITLPIVFTAEIEADSYTEAKHKTAESKLCTELDKNAKQILLFSHVISIKSEDDKVTLLRPIAVEQSNMSSIKVRADQ